MNRDMILTKKGNKIHTKKSKPRQKHVGEKITKSAFPTADEEKTSVLPKDGFQRTDPAH